MIAVGKINNVVLSFGELEYWDNGYPIVGGVAYDPKDVLLFDVDVPQDYTAGKYCYTAELGFYINPKYSEPNPYGISDELVEQIKNDAITEIEEAVVNGTDD